MLQDLTLLQDKVKCAIEKYQDFHLTWGKKVNSNSVYSRDSVILSTIVDGNTNHAGDGNPTIYRVEQRSCPRVSSGDTRV